MDGITINAFRMILLAASDPEKPVTGSIDPIRTALMLIEGQCRVLREVHGEGDGLEE